MRLLFINSRPDAVRSPGGDTIQAQKTQAALESLGVHVEARAANDLDSLPAVDLAHIFNIQEPEPAWAAFQRLEGAGIPVVLSPIYWDMLAYWYEMAVQSVSLWKQTARFLGKGTVKRIYLAWQRLKAPSKQDWQTQRRLLLHARRALPNSQSETDLLQQFFRLGKDFQRKADVVPNAIDTDLYETQPAPSQEFEQQYGVRDFVLQVGTVNPVKNQLGLIEALYDLPISLVFIGPVQPAYLAYGEACKARAAQRGRVIFIDHLPHNQLPGIYALAAVHALPSWRETPGLVSLEAAAAGCRVVSTSIGSPRDYFGDLAWYCYPDDPASIRKAVEQALKAPRSQELRQRVLTEYTWQRAAQATLSSYLQALKAKPIA
jgi:glycosyltransferase involved in cell wall biosynthesis